MAEAMNGDMMDHLVEDKAEDRVEDRVEENVKDSENNKQHGAIFVSGQRVGGKQKLRTLGIVAFVSPIYR